KKLTIFGDGKQSRNFTHVQDIVKANILAAKSDVVGGIFNIGGDGKRVVLNEAIDLMEDIIGKEANREYQKVVKGDVKHTSADTSKAKEMLGYEPEIEFEDGLRREVEFLKKLYN
ncbi:MAG: GDP-mannose 4,6-dehydratase, partial [bacterium]